mgnify:CR=1 FL=1
MTRLEQAITIRARNELDPCFDSVARNQFLKMKAKLFAFHDINDGLDERKMPWFCTGGNCYSTFPHTSRCPDCWDKGFEELEKEGGPEL